MPESSWAVCECDSNPCTCYEAPIRIGPSDLAEAERLRDGMAESRPAASAWLARYLEEHGEELVADLRRPTEDLIREALDARPALSVPEETMTDPTPVPEILDGVDTPLDDDQMADARRFVLRLRSWADRDHYDAGGRWRARCHCGGSWPCRDQVYVLDSADLMESVVSELMTRRRYARPLTGLDKVQDAVRAARGGDAPRQFRGFA